MIELYEASAAPFSLSSFLFGGSSASAARSAYAPPPLQALTQTFISALPIARLDVTRTEQGLTSKQASQPAGVMAGCCVDALPGGCCAGLPAAAWAAAAA